MHSLSDVAYMSGVQGLLPYQFLPFQEVHALLAEVSLTYERSPWLTRIHTGHPHTHVMLQ